ncbi:MAG: ANTAR domain-containing protein [Ruminococcus sp.]|nr:ANTAR domain-containing protein [Ruminococcus sp.]
MESVLIVSAGKASQTISALISEYFPDWQQSAALTGKEAKALISDRAFDMIVINCPLPDGSGEELWQYAGECSDAGIVLLVPPEQYEELCRRAKVTGAAVVRKQPLAKAGFEYTLGLVSGFRRRLLGREAPQDKTAQELQNIGRAKLALMHYLKFTEQQAHRYLERQAMELRIPMNEAALRVIKMYDLEAK